MDLIKSDTTHEKKGWVLVENKPPEIKYRVLLLPGFLCTDCIYTDMLNDPLILKSGIQLVAGNPPGFKGQPANEDFDYTIESYAKEVETFNALEPFDLIVGHSFFANVMIEVAARNQYPGPIMLISPSLYRNAEGLDTRILDNMSRIPGIGHLTIWMASQMPESLFESCFTKENQDKIKPIAAEAEKTPPAVARILLNAFFDYIDKYENLTDRLLTTHQPVWYVRGDKDNIKFPEDARRRLNASPMITIKDVCGGMHFIMIDQPCAINKIILEILLNNR
jgi:pimeloyl-ACP methyl ester carboxylesterase